MLTFSQFVRGGLVAAGAAMLASAATAAPDRKSPEHHRDCFFINQWQGWKSPSPDVIYIGVNLHEVYKIQLSTPASELSWPDAHLISRVRGGSTICDALDLDLSVADANGFRQPLIATSITKLTKDEIAQIPPKFRP